LEASGWFLSLAILLPEKEPPVPVRQEAVWIPDPISNDVEKRKF
jgi:hypothetical protein